jgi:hypothetical protein
MPYAKTTRSLFGWRSARSFCLAVVFSTMAAAQNNAPSGNEGTTFAAWDAFAGQLRSLGDQLVAHLPERLRDDPQVRQEAGRVLLEAVAAETIQAISADPDYPVFLPSSNITFDSSQPNADTTYKTAVIAPGGQYRLRGVLGSLVIFNVAQYARGAANSGSKKVPPTYDDFKALHHDAAGHFDVILSPTRPAGYNGDWWELKPNTNFLFLRQVAYDWTTERDPTLSIERLDKPAARPRPDAAELEKRLRDLEPAISRSLFLLVDHVEQMRKDGYINRLKPWDLANAGGVPKQFYYEGAYEIGPDQALILEAKVPEGCAYWSTILTNDLFETTDWYNHQSSLNGTQAVIDHDGTFRAVISEKDPGVPNWLDTAGYRSGSIQGRWNGCSAQPVPSVRKVAFADLRRLLPPDTKAVTPAQREEALRDRRSHVQQRPLW